MVLSRQPVRPAGSGPTSWPGPWSRTPSRTPRRRRRCAGWSPEARRGMRQGPAAQARGMFTAPDRAVALPGGPAAAGLWSGWDRGLARVGTCSLGWWGHDCAGPDAGAGSGPTACSSGSARAAWASSTWRRTPSSAGRAQGRCGPAVAERPERAAPAGPRGRDHAAGAQPVRGRGPRRRRDLRAALHRHPVRARPDAGRGGEPGRPADAARPWPGWPPGWPTPWPRSTRRAWCTATSSRAT